MASSCLSFSTSSCLSFSTLVNVGLVFIFVLLTGGCSACDLSTNFYSKSCPKIFSTVKPIVVSAVAKERRMGASLLRLHFHDCFVHGCDASVLLDDTSSFRGEKTAGPNNNSVRGYEVIDKIKSKVEKSCPGVVSCADIVAIAARDSAVILGGPSWAVKLGRRDSKTASFAAANNNLPSPTSTLKNLINRFKAKGLSVKDMVALSGSHTIGQARCTSFADRIYNDTNIHDSFAKKRQARCARNLKYNNLAPLDVQTPNAFDNKYYKNLLEKKGLLHSDQVLFNGDSTDSLVRHYSKKRESFNSDFAAAMIKMGDISPLTGSRGEIRKHCRKPN